MEEATRLYVGNLPYVAQKSDIEALFAENNVPIQKVDISTDPFTGRNPSYCFVNFDSAEDAAKAMETMQGQMLRGRPIKINLKTERKPQGNRLPTKSYDQGWRPVEVPTTKANSNAFAFDRWNREDANSHWTAPLEEERRLWVGGLPYIPNQDAVQAEIRDLFQGWNVQAISKIISPHATKWSEPGSHYFCFVDLNNNQEAVDAMRALNGKETPYGGKYKVSIAKHKRPTIVQREQLGETEATRPRREREEPTRPKREGPPRDLSGNWRRAD